MTCVLTRYTNTGRGNTCALFFCCAFERPGVRLGDGPLGEGPLGDRWGEDPLGEDPLPKIPKMRICHVFCCPKS